MERNISLPPDQARNIRTPSWQDLSYVFPFKPTAHPSALTGRTGQVSYLPVRPGFLQEKPWRAPGAEFHFLSGLTLSLLWFSRGTCVARPRGEPILGGHPRGSYPGVSSQGGPFPAPPEPLSKAQVMLPSSRLIGWWVPAAFIDTARCPKADGSKEIKYNSACC